MPLDASRSRRRDVPSASRLDGSERASPLGPFAPSDGLDGHDPRRWIARLAEGTEVIVPDRFGVPGDREVSKAVSVVNAIGHLESRARLLLQRLPEGTWRLHTIDFGDVAAREGFEFLMRFAFEARAGAARDASPCVEIGFTLHRQASLEPLFLVSLRQASWSW